MNEPRRPLVTIDDPVTIIEPHRVLLEWVEQVNREFFIVCSHGTTYRHDAEGTTWARGHHLPDSEVVVALRAAASLVDAAAASVGVREEPPGSSKMAREMMKRALLQRQSMTPSSDFAKLMEDARKATAEAKAITGHAWWKGVFK